MSAGGYHHHLGANTWHSLDAPHRDKDTLGLKSFAFLIPDEANWLALYQRIRSAGRTLQAIETDGNLGIALEDDDGIGVELITPEGKNVRRALTNTKIEAR
jgi:catechol 2,3-dioxygenase